jgi:putative ABC transport system ATP-binding protein
LAVALANDPVVLIADEPTGEVDSATEQRILELLAAEAEAGRAIVVATHSDSVAAVAHRVVVLADGIVVSGAAAGGGGVVGGGVVGGGVVGGGVVGGGSRAVGVQPTAGPVVVVEGVARTYGSGTSSVVAVHDVSCRVEAGARVVVVGPSGSGKSTLLHLLAGLDHPTVGTVTWPALGGPPLTLRPGTVGVVFQGPSLVPALDAGENVALPLQLAGVDDGTAMAAALQALGELGLGAVARQLPEELSGGQAQRVAVARALVGRPQLIVADEPTGQLDHGAAASVLEALEQAAAAAGAALVVSTHDAVVAGRFTERWVMADGRIEATATQDEVRPTR